MIFAYNQINVVMGQTLSLVGAALLIIWIVEYFAYNAGDGIHVLLLVAIGLFLVKAFMHFPSRISDKADAPEK